jgi:hypothetical protein
LLAAAVYGGGDRREQSSRSWPQKIGIVVDTNACVASLRTEPVVPTQRRQHFDNRALEPAMHKPPWLVMTFIDIDLGSP